MADLHGVVSWPGVQAVLSCTYTISHGISPGVAILKILPQAETFAEVGDLVITDGEETITLRDCKVTGVKRSEDGSGFVDSLEILDRRWKWRDLGSIFGWYNQLDPHGKLIPWTIQSPTELAKLCLKAMGETRFKIDLPAGFNSTVGKLVSQIAPPWIGVAPTTGTNPAVTWINEVPAVALAALVESFGRRVIYRWSDDSVLIAIPGRGGELPDGSLAKRAPTLKSPETPTGVEVVGDSTRYQVRLLLEAVGLEWDGSYRKLNDLSYRPREGWEKLPPRSFWGTVGADGLTYGIRATDRLTLTEAVELAKKSVYRCYRLADVGPKGVGPIVIPGYGPLVRKQQIWLQDTQVEQVKPEPQDPNLKDRDGRPLTVNFYNGYSRDKPAAVYGSIANYINRAFWTDNLAENANSDPARQLFVGFSIDPFQQVVTFNDYVYWIGNEGVDLDDPVNVLNRLAGVASADTYLYLPATLILQTGCLIRDPDTNAFDCMRVSAILPGMKGLTNFASRRYPDVQLCVIGKYDDDNNVTGAVELEEDPHIRADHYLNGLKLQYIEQAGLTLEYNGIRAIDLDGAISQITWTVGEQGASTVGSRNAEHSIWVPPYPARRRAEWLPPAKQQQISQAASSASDPTSMALGMFIEGGR